MPSILSPGYTQGPYVDTEANAELEAAMTAAGASYDTVEYRVHGGPENSDEATDEQLNNASYIAPGRRVLNLTGRTWGANPNTCTDYSDSGEWVLGGLVLVCRGCGLDCT